MQHQLIMVIGDAPGAGKSTLSYFLYQQLTAHAIPVRWFYEEDHIETFRSFWQHLYAGASHLDTHLLAAIAAFVDTHRGSTVTHITDSSIPGYRYLFGNTPSEHIAAFGQAAYTRLVPLDPLLIYLDSDPAIAIPRAVQERGERWLERCVASMNRWFLPLYDGLPFRTLSDMVTYYQQLRAFQHAHVMQWPGEKIILTTTQEPLETSQQTLLQYLGLAPHPQDHRVSIDDLAEYVGTYTRVDGSEQAMLIIEQGTTGLMTNVYWPNGTRLIPEGTLVFRLQATSNVMTFERGPTGRIQGLTLQLRGEQTMYRKTAESS